MNPKGRGSTGDRRSGRGRTDTGGEPAEAPADRSIRAVARLEREAVESRSIVDHMATTITGVAGSGAAIVVHAVWFSTWIVANTGVFGLEPFDPFPFSFLTMIVSLEAIFLTLFVLISQNRMSREADRRAELDLQVNVLAEMEATTILRMLRDISAHLGIKETASKEMAELLKETRLDELARKLEKELPEQK